MGAPTTLRPPFGQKLRNELDRRGWGVRTLARTMAEQQGAPERVESIRRQLKRYLSPTEPVQPTVSTRHAIEDGLGLDRDSLAGSDDDEESDPVNDLVAALRALVREEFKARA